MVTKECSKCLMELDTSAFGIRRASKDGLAYLCYSCRRIYRQSTSKHRQDYQRKYFSDPVKVEKRKQQCKEYRLKNPLYAKNKVREYLSNPIIRERKYKAKSLWSKKNKLHVANYNRKRRELRLNLDFKYSNNDVNYTQTLFNNRCFNCSSTKNLSIDHHYPLKLNEGLSYDNAVLLCKSCNSKKKDRLPEIFYSPEKLSELHLLGIKNSPKPRIL